MSVNALVNAGPLIALFDRDEAYHKRVVELIRGFSGQLISNLSVITEVSHLLDFNLQVQLDFLSWIQTGAVELEPVTKDDLETAGKLMAKYGSLPMDLADAILVTHADRLSCKQVITLDKDFQVYRYKGRGYFRNLLD